MCEDKLVDDPVRIIIRDKEKIYLDVGVKTAYALDLYLKSPVEVPIEDLWITIKVQEVSE